METISALSAAFSLSKSTLAGLKRIGEVELRLEMVEKMLQLQETIQTAKQDVFALQNENMALAEENKQLRNEQAEREKHLLEAELYVLREVAPNVCAYVKKDTGDDLYRAQKLCQPCFDKGVKSYFNFEKADFHTDILSCHQCGLRIRVPNDIKMDCLTTPRTPRGF